MKKQVCDVEAAKINYTIYTKNSSSVSKISSAGAGNHGIAHQRIRHVLKDVSCRAKPWEILAIVGPSGAGKSSLLEILAGKITAQRSSVFVNRKPVDRARFKKISGYVTQKDSLFPLLTVEETLRFSAKLRMKISEPALANRVKTLIHELGLGHISRARIGDDRVRGISGGERRRVSIGVEVIHDPRVLILDEPTSGLDSNSALQIIDMVKTMAETQGRTVILSIHQPGFRIVKLFNSILLLANGSVLHHGTVDQLGFDLRLMGLQPPVHVNIVEFAIDSIETIQQEGIQNRLLERATTEVKFTLQQLFRISRLVEEENDVVETDLPIGFPNSRFRETVILTHRFSMNIFRTKELFACRTITMLVSGLVLGSIFQNLKDDIPGMQEKVGLFAFILTFLLSTTIEALPVFLQEREILMKETSCGSYRVSSYAVANALVYLPFLLILAFLFSLPLYLLVGLNRTFAAFSNFLVLIWLILYTANSVVICFSAIVPDFIVGNSVISGVMGSFFLFSGYFVSKNGIPKYWIFMHYISLFKYPFEGFLINEFSASGKCLQLMLGDCLVSGEDMLKEEGYGDESKWKTLIIMVAFILFYRLISFVILRVICSRKGLKSIFHFLN